MEAQPLVPVVIPTYNAVGVISECLVSVLGQAYGDYKVIVVDNASTARAGGDNATVRWP